MTIAATLRIAGPYAGNGSATTFPFNFAVLDPNDVYVETLQVATGQISIPTQDLTFTVSLNSDQDSSPGGSITLVSPLAGHLTPVPTPLLAGYTLRITTKRPPAQTLDLTNGGAFYPDVINAALDSLTVQVQQLAAQMAMCMQAPFVDDWPGFTLPPAAQRANNLLAFDSQGNAALVATTAIPSGGGGGGGAGGGSTSVVPSAQAAIGTIDGTNTTFTFTAPTGAGTSTPVPVVFVGGVFQTPGTDYTSPVTQVGTNTWQISFLSTSVPTAGPITVVLFG